MKPPILPVALTGQHVRLTPLAPDHLPGLQLAVTDGDLWRLWYTSIPTPSVMQAEITRRLNLQEAGSMIPFPVWNTQTNTIAGMTTYMNIDRNNQRVEIGSTWYAQSVQRTKLNTQAKRLLLAHAFETLACIAVEFRTHFLNQQSRRAIERLGAKLDGILRSHQLASDGSLRDTCAYSIVASEWPAVRAHLDAKLAK